MKNFYLKSLTAATISIFLTLVSMDNVSSGNDTLQLSDNDSSSSLCKLTPLFCPDTK